MKVVMYPIVSNPIWTDMVHFFLATNTTMLEINITSIAMAPTIASAKYKKLLFVLSTTLFPHMFT